MSFRCSAACVCRLTLADGAATEPAPGERRVRQPAIAKPETTVSNASAAPTPNARIVGVANRVWASTVRYFQEST